MRITVKLFAILRDRAGVSEVVLEVPQDATVAAAARLLGAQQPALGNLLKRVAYAVNRCYVPVETPLADGDELAIIPPVSGG